MGRPSARDLVRMLREFSVAAGPETWLVWTPEEQAAMVSLHDKCARFCGMHTYAEWAFAGLPDEADDGTWLPDADDDVKKE